MSQSDIMDMLIVARDARDKAGEALMKLSSAVSALEFAYLQSRHVKIRLPSQADLKERDRLVGCDDEDEEQNDDGGGEDKKQKSKKNTKKRGRSDDDGIGCE